MRVGIIWRKIVADSVLPTRGYDRSFQICQPCCKPWYIVCFFAGSDTAPLVSPSRPGCVFCVSFSGFDSASFISSSGPIFSSRSDGASRVSSAGYDGVSCVSSSGSGGTFYLPYSGSGGTSCISCLLSCYTGCCSGFSSRTSSCRAPFLPIDSSSLGFTSKS